ncbi:hypothetical protein CEXT_184811 [Caerostris extrusa]|uniref:Uncharacterized protein n=1 Tax=Caerostris extrusa TaxID=172846 RepID=A0AAV4U3E1_CAEEX|nr:hypothetical protein CEXT_184811 [Caerostris extrusa]
MVSTLDSESSDPSSNLGGTYFLLALQLPCGLVVRIPGFHPGGPGSIPGMGRWFHGVMVSTLDSESSDPSSNLGGT